jgi:hypothetical protein
MGLFQILIYFYKGKTVDSRPGPGGALAGAWLTGAAEPGSSPWVGEKIEELRGVLTEGFGGRFDGEVRPAAVKLGEGRLGAPRVGNGGGDECVEERRAPRPFIGSEGGSGAAGQGRGSGGRWWRHQCRSSGSGGRGNRVVTGE